MIKSKNCSHIFCEICLFMWLQKNNKCPICRKNIDETIQIYFPCSSGKVNNRLLYLKYSIENVKLDNFAKYSEKCLICGKLEPKEQLIICDNCNYFQTHLLCDPPTGLIYGKFYCRFCRKKFIQSIKSCKNK